jgi:4'-phosphopantetheinyl transferase
VLLLFSKISGEESCDRILSLLPDLPFSYRKKLESFKRWQDVQASLLGRLLLMQGMETLNENIDFNDIRYTQNGKPVLDSSLIKFNISHSGDWVVCALVAEGEIGVDIQQITGVNLDSYQRIISETQYEEIIAATDINAAFLNYWVKREAVCKADGRGILHSSKSVEIDNDYFLDRIEIDPGYICYTATSVKQVECVIKIIN